MKYYYRRHSYTDRLQLFHNSTGPLLHSSFLVLNTSHNSSFADAVASYSFAASHVRE